MRTLRRLMLSLIIALPLAMADELFVVAKATLDLADETTRYRLVFGDVVSGRRLDRDNVEVSWLNATAKVPLSALWPEDLASERGFVEQEDLANEIDASVKQRDQTRANVLELYEKSYTLTLDQAKWIVMQQIGPAREGPATVKAMPPRTFRKGSRRMRRELSTVIDDIDDNLQALKKLDKEIGDAIRGLAGKREHRRHLAAAVQAYARDPKACRFQEFHVVQRSTAEGREGQQTRILNKGESIQAQILPSSPKWVETEGGSRIRLRNLESAVNRRVRHARAMARAQSGADRLFDEIHFHQACLELLESTELDARVHSTLDGEWLVIEDPDDCAHCRRPKKNADCRQGIIERLDSRNLKKWRRDWQDERERLLETMDQKWAAYGKARRQTVMLALVGKDL
jgi:hypothetical protein